MAQLQRAYLRSHSAPHKYPLSVLWRRLSYREFGYSKMTEMAHLNHIFFFSLAVGQEFFGKKTLADNFFPKSPSTLALFQSLPLNWCLGKGTSLQLSNDTHCIYHSFKEWPLQKLFLFKFVYTEIYPLSFQQKCIFGHLVTGCKPNQRQAFWFL